ncbi:MAG: HDOD domain-containing protein [Deltaproteobacteria bacterium]|nr:HDOD domain-containing protein [Deltaproteobacteria bacterium]
MQDLNSVLFVDDEPRVLEGLQALLRKHRKSWEMSFAAGGEEALARLAERPFDVVVTDLRMPRVDGMSVLQHLVERYPHTMRVVLSGECGKDSTLKFVPYAHLSLVKPCAQGELEDVLARGAFIKDLIDDPRIRQAVGAVRELPPLPRTFRELQAVLADPDAGLRAVADVVSGDIALSAKILKLTNSSFFGLGRNVKSVAEAVPLLGVEAVKCLTLTTSLFAPEKVPPRILALAESLHAHSMAVASLSAKLAPPEHTREAFAAGILHDVGRMVMGVELPELEPDDVTNIGRMQSAAGAPRMIDAAHAHVGAYLLALWGLPLGVVGAVAGHHGDPRWRDKSPVAGAVYAAEALLGYVCAGRVPSAEDNERLDRLVKTFRTLAPADIGGALASLG